MAFRKPICFQVTLELTAEQRDTLERDGIFDPRRRHDLRNLARFAVRQVIEEMDENQGEQDARERASDHWDD